MTKRAGSLFVALAAAALVQAAEVSSLHIASQAMARDIPATLILPDSYAGGTNRYPVLYLLHGAGGTHASWANGSKKLKLADRYEVIVVCPDGSPTSWYFDSPIDPAFQFETHVAEEVIQYIDQHYRTKSDRQHRALCGNSMGGHGALFLAIRHKETFGTAVALSGGVDIRPFPGNWDISKRIGTIEEHPENWEELTVINQIHSLKNGELAMAFDCGVEDFFLEVNRALHNQLINAGIDHHYEENPGAHTWDYWQAAVQRQMPFIMREFDQ